MRWISVASGMLFMAAGAVAVATGEFDGAGIWFLAAGLAVIGLVGLVGNIATSVAESGSP